MPDYVNHFRGRIRDPNAPEASDGKPAGGAGAPAAKDGKAKKGTAAAEEQVLKLSNERISVPEILFQPSDIGIEQAGLAETIVQAVEACVPDMRDALYSNVILTGGSALFPNLEERLRRELRALVPSEVDLGITRAPDPIVATWQGASIFAASDAYPSQTVTRAEYHEGGHSLCRRRFLAQSC
jgi:actin-related protein 6